jgi:hypothetical protein
MGENFSSFSRFSLKVGLSNEAAATCEICDDRFPAFSAWSALLLATAAASNFSRWCCFFVIRLRIFVRFLRVLACSETQAI